MAVERGLVPLAPIPNAMASRTGTASREKLLVTPEDAAQMLSLGRTTVYALLQTGDLFSVRVGRARRIPIGAIEAFVAGLSAREGVA